LIRIRILGSAAGGGLPQWNCACPNCVAARAGKIARQAQSSVAISGNDECWFLVNASPDLSEQIERTSGLQPSPDSPRNSPLAGVLLTNADLDHGLGLLLLRQQERPIVVYTTDETRAALDWIDTVLKRFCGVEWRPVSRDFIWLSKSIAFRAISLPRSIALQFRDQSSNTSALVAPAVGKLSDELHDAIKTSDVVLFDGTFWKDDELLAFRPGAKKAREMNHLPIADGSLDFLRHSPARRKMYIHINNTNPILMPGSRERAQVEQAGVEIACDGLEIAL
jgi:pyrroloquinoline quinone biosynthesis protein B